MLCGARRRGCSAVSDSPGRADEAARARDCAQRRPGRRRQEGEPGPLLHGGHEPEAFLARHSPRRDRDGEIVDRVGPHARPPSRPPPLHGRPAARSRRGGGDPLYVLATDPPRTSSSSARAKSSLRRERRAFARATLYRPGARVDQVQACATAPSPSGAGSRASRGRGRMLPSAVELEETANGVAPGQTACLLAGDRVDRLTGRSLHKLGRWARHARQPRSGTRSSLLRGARPQALPSASLVPSVLRPVGAAHDGRHAALQALFPGPGRPAAPAPDLLPEVLPHHRHRSGRADGAPSHVLRDARQLLDRRLLQAGRGRVRMGALDGRLRARSRPDLDHGLRGRRGARPRARRGGDRVLALVGVPASGSSDCRARRTSGRLVPSAPAAPARSYTSTVAPTSARRGRPPRRRHRPLPRVLEPRLHAVLAARGRLARRRCRSATSTRAPGSNGWRRSSRTSRRSSRTTRSGRWSSWASASPAAATVPDPATTRALRVLADHSRAMTFLIADGVVPSNEDRGYILRRVMRRAIQQGRVDRSRVAVPRPVCRPGDRARWARLSGAREGARTRSTSGSTSEEESFGRTLDQGTRLLAELVEQAQGEQGTSWISAEDAFKLHDTYGFPYDLTRELLAEEGLSVDDAGFEELMEEQRERARMGTATRPRQRGRARAGASLRAQRRASSPGSSATRRPTTTRPSARSSATTAGVLAKFPESPFYAEGGGQVADSGIVETDSGRGRVEDVYRVGDDQAVALAVEQGELKEGERARLVVDRLARHATACNHTATHLLHAALREQLGTHVRQAGSAVRPDKLRFDFTHGKALSPEELGAIEDQVNEWITESRPGARDPHDAQAGRGAWRDGALRREVRRRGADGRGRGRLARALRRHARPDDVRGRRLQGRLRGLERGERPPDRGRYRTRGAQCFAPTTQLLAQVAGRLRMAPQTPWSTRSRPREREGGARALRRRRAAGGRSCSQSWSRRPQEVDGLKVVTERARTRPRGRARPLRPRQVEAEGRRGRARDHGGGRPAPDRQLHSRRPSTAGCPRPTS